ncbi:MAG TPA: DUF4352 domain-containing protein [Solirubrobacterales bacterium]|jgi:hypothetical protein
MLRKALIVIAMLMFAFPLMGADDSCSEEEPTVERQGGGKATGATAAIGDKLTLKGTTYRVTDAETAKQIGGQYTGATANGTFVVVDIQLTNEEDEPATILEDNIRIVGGNGSTYSTSDDAILVYPDQTLLLEEIQPGVTESGKLVYDLPSSAVSGARLQVEDLFSGSTGEIKLGL